MRRNAAWLLVVAAVIVIVFVLVRRGREYDWDNRSIYWDGTSDEPCGLQVFDDFAARTATHGYRFQNEGVDSVSTNVSLLYIDPYESLPDDEWSTLVGFVERGNSVMIVAENFNLSDTYEYDEYDEDSTARAARNDVLPLGCTFSRPRWFSTDNLRKAFRAGLYESIIPSDKLPATRDSVLLVNKYFLTSYLVTDDELWTPLASAVFSDSENEDVECGLQTIAAVRSIGKGKLYMVSTPYLFTNYGALDPQMSQYLRRLLSLIDDRPIIRVSSLYEVGYTYQTDYEGESTLAFILDNQPLRWALFTAVAAILLFMAFTARRRQRVIPYVAEPRNRTVEFAILLGNVYYKHRDRDDLFAKKYTCFADELRRTQLIDVEASGHEAEVIARLAGTTGLPRDRVSVIMRQVWAYTGQGGIEDDNTLRSLIDGMDLILAHCRDIMHSAGINKK